MIAFLYLVDEIKFIGYDYLLEILKRYGKLLLQKTKLWMFVPYDEYGNVLEEKKPFQDNYYLWEQAKERCLFKGFEVCNRQSELTCLIHNSYHHPLKHLLDRTVEELVQYDIELTPTTLKQIGYENNN